FRFTTPWAWPQRPPTLISPTPVSGSSTEWIWLQHSLTPDKLTMPSWWRVKMPSRFKRPHYETFSRIRPPVIISWSNLLHLPSAHVLLLQSCGALISIRNVTESSVVLLAPEHS